MVKRQPLFINLDASLETLNPQEALRIHNYTIDSDGNGALPTATGNGVDEGTNEVTLKPIRSNNKLPDSVLPEGYNQTVGCFESITTQELYYMNKNSNGKDGIYVFDGNTGQWAKVIEDAELRFSDAPEAFMANHRVTLRATYDENKNIIEKHLIITDGHTWQKWINVVAAIKTNGFDASLFPYWSSVPPHFERRHLLEYAVRPPMIKPQCELLPNTPDDANVINRLVGKWFVFAYDVEYTDGRKSVLSPWSEPVIVRQEGFLLNPQFIPKKIRVRLDAGNCLVEKINLYVKINGSDFLLYDTIKKFDDVGPNSIAVIGNEYWKRVNPFAKFNFNREFNTIDYIFDNSKLASIVSPKDTMIYENELPIKSVACADLGDAILFSNNLKDYNNFTEEITQSIKVNVEEKSFDGCNVPMRKIRLYAAAVTQGLDAGGNWGTQCPYFKKEGESQVRFGGVQIRAGLSDIIDNLTVTDASSIYELHFADRKAFRCYLKGTDYYADGKWHYGTSLGTLTPFDDIPVMENDNDKKRVEEILRQGNFFVCVFDFLVPAGVYSAAIARHNSPSASDYRTKSTYIMGLADSRRVQLKPRRNGNIAAFPPTTITSNDKEMVIDCRFADVDVRGNGADMFLIFAPEQRFKGSGVRAKYKLIEGYLYESAADDSRVPVEFFPYSITEGQQPIIGNYTDKNGFFWAYSSDGDAREAQIRIRGVKDCGAVTTIFTSRTPRGNWANNVEAFLSRTPLRLCNRVVVRGRVQDATGAIGFSNVGISINGGGEVFTDENGNFELFVHNGYVGAPPTTVGRAILVNGSSGFVVRTTACEVISPEPFVPPPCGTSCDVERQILLNYNVKISNNSGQTSLKENGNYPVAIVGFDYAGRSTRANLIAKTSVPSFLQRNNFNPTQLTWQITQDFSFPDHVAWVAFYVAKNRTHGRYIQWIGDAIEFLDADGKVTSNTSSAYLVRIKIESLLKTNIENNFSMLADYQFVRGDRLRILDNGSGQLLNTATFGEPIDVEIYGTNYNEAAAFAGLIELNKGKVAPTEKTVGQDPRHILVRYSPKFDVLKGASGFWIEVYNPNIENENILYGEANVYPVVNGKIVRYEGMSGNRPLYTNITNGNITFWDTYHINRTITSGAPQSINHIFESPNITDLWGKDVISTGRVNVENDKVRQQWYRDNTIRSDEFLVDGIINGLGLFRSENQKDFKGYQWGGIVATIPQRSAMLFICENDWFLTDFNLNYAQVREGNLVVVNLGQSLSEPRQKIGDNYGCSYEDTKTVVANDNLVFWHDQKNTALVMCNYSRAVDITNIEEQGRSTGIKAYYSRKTELRGQHNAASPTSHCMDVVTGIDVAYDNLYVTFRRRRGSKTNINDFVNEMRGYNFYEQETFVFDIGRMRWVRTVGFTPEAYCSLRGSKVGKEFISFALGHPYRHNDNSVKDFCNFYGIQTERFLTLCVNELPEISKVLQSVALDSNKMAMFSDMLYGTERYAFSRIPMNRFVFRDGYWYGEVLRDESSFATDANRSMLMDGKAIRGPYFVIRLVGDPERKSDYQELNAVYFKFASVDQTDKK